MLRRLALIASLALAPISANAQFANIGPTPPVSDNGDRLATTAWVNNLIASGLSLASGKIWIGSSGNIATPQTPSGDCTFSLSGVITCTQAAGSFTVVGNLSVGGSIIDGNGILATNIVAPATPAAGTTRIYVDSTTKALTFKNDAGTVGNAVVPLSCSASQWVNTVSAAGVIGCAQPGVANLSGTGTGVATALGVNVGSAGAFVTFNGAGGTPSALVGTNISGTATSLTAGNATKLATARAIGIAGSTGLTATGVNFDGTAAINPALTGTLVVANGGTGDTGTAWSTYTPSPVCSGGTVTTNTARSKTLGKTVFWQVELTVATGPCNTTSNQLTFTLPSTAQSGASTAGYENAGGANVFCAVAASSSTLSCRSTINLVATSHVILSGVYESQ